MTGQPVPKTPVRELTDRLEDLADDLYFGDYDQDTHFVGGVPSVTTVREAAATIKLLRILFVEATNRALRLEGRTVPESRLSERYYELQTGGV